MLDIIDSIAEIMLWKNLAVQASSGVASTSARFAECTPTVSSRSHSATGGSIFCRLSKQLVAAYYYLLADDSRPLHYGRM